jgi:mannose-1-phosphate guanylyltransferase
VNDLDIPVLGMGLKNVVIAASTDGILVSDKMRSGYMKPYVEKLAGGSSARFAEKSWGTYTVIDVQPGSMTVKVNLRAGAHMTYQMHERRDEVWTVVSGTGRTIVDGMEQVVKAGDVVSIAAGCRHTVIADTDLNIVEIQIGEEVSKSDKYTFAFPSTVVLEGETHEV